MKITSTLVATAAVGLLLSQSTPPVHAAPTSSDGASPVAAAADEGFWDAVGSYGKAIGKGAITGAVTGAVSCGTAGAAVGAVVGAGAGAAGWIWDQAFGLEPGLYTYPPDALDHI